MAAGGGSGGGYVGGSEREGESGGGGGEFMRRVPLHVTPGVAVSGRVGSGGARGIYHSTIAASGTTSSFGPFKCLGGQGGGLNNTGSNVGSVGGGYKAAIPPAGVDGNKMVFEYAGWTAGAGGGSVSSNGRATGYSGGSCEGNIGVPGGAHFFDSGSGAFWGGGSGGASGGWGVGGSGGNGNTAGNDAPVGSYGAGGGGGGAFSITGGGHDGYILIEWQGP